METMRVATYVYRFCETNEQACNYIDLPTIIALVGEPLVDCAAQGELEHKGGLRARHSCGGKMLRPNTRDVRY